VRFEAHQALDFWALPKAESACVFLNQNGDCDVYEDRPAACRTFAVTSEPHLCSKEASKSGDGMVDRTFSLGAEAWSSAAINLPGVAHDPLPLLLLKALEPPRPQPSPPRPPEKLEPEPVPTGRQPPGSAPSRKTREF